MQSFAWGTVASVVGSIVAFGILSDTMGGVGGLASSMTGSIEDGWKVAAALLAKNIGGGINYIAGGCIQLFMKYAILRWVLVSSKKSSQFVKRSTSHK